MQSAPQRRCGKLGETYFMLIPFAIKNEGLRDIIRCRSDISFFLRVGKIFSGDRCHRGIIGIKNTDDTGYADIFLVSYMEIHEKRSFLLFGKHTAAYLDLLGIADQIRLAGGDDDLFS